jgi:long-chain acyl-CoA synthetase
MTVETGTADTFPKLLLHHARVRGARPAIREKALGIWQSWTWEQVREEVECLACGLAQAGLARGDHIAVIGANRPRLYWTLIAAQSLGAIPVPFYEDAVAQEMVYVFQNAEIAFEVVEDQEQADKLRYPARVPQIEAHLVRRCAGPAPLLPARARILREPAGGGESPWGREPRLRPGGDRGRPR